MRPLTVFGKFSRLLITSVFSMGLITACSEGSNFSGGNGKAEAKKPKAEQNSDSTPVKPSKQESLDNENEETEDSNLDDETVQPEVIDDDIKLPENTIVKGSFRVWTVPADPAPMQKYDIYIDVKIPASATNYTKEDLSGDVIGTDGYRQPIGRDANFLGKVMQRFESFPGRATLIISVPGALNLVKDTIKIKSTLLNEAQNIEIVF